MFGVVAQAVCGSHLIVLVLFAQNELYEDQIKRRKRHQSPANQQENVSNAGKPSKRLSNQKSGSGPAHSNVLTESNIRRVSSPRKQQPKEPSKRLRPHEEDRDDEVAPQPTSKKKKMISTSATKLYCICETPYDDTK